MRFERRHSRRRGQGAFKLIAIILIVGFAGLCAFLVARQSQYRVRLAGAEAALADVQTQKVKLEEQLAATQVQKTDEQDTLELVRLRGEVASLRPLQKQVQQLQAENKQLKTSMQQLQQSTADTTALRTQNQQLQGALQAKAQADACVANLRQIEAAKAAWAAQFGKQPNEIPTEADLFGPDKPLPQKPVCPGGGVYNLNPVGARPSCTVPGHSY